MEQFSHANSVYFSYPLLFAEKVTKIPQAKLVESWVTGRKPLPWREAAKVFGIQVTEKIVDPIIHFAGFQIQWRGTQGIVTKVMNGSAAEDAQLAPQDEIISINGIRITDAEKLNQVWKKIISKKAKFEILYARLDKTKSVWLKPRAHKALGIEYVGKKLGTVKV